MKKKENEKAKNLLTSLIVSILVLGVIVAATFWYQDYKNVVFDKWVVIISDAVGFLVVFGIVYAFMKGPKKEKNEDTWDIK